jgi:hypothetical protein
VPDSNLVARSLATLIAWLKQTVKRVVLLNRQRSGRGLIFRQVAMLPVKSYPLFLEFLLLQKSLMLIVVGHIF